MGLPGRASTAVRCHNGSRMPSSACLFIWGVYSVPSYIHINREGSVYDCHAEWYQVLAMSKKGPSRDFHDRVYGKDFAYRQFALMPFPSSK